MLWRFLARRRRVLIALLVPLAAFASVTSGVHHPSGSGPLEAAAALVLAPLQAGATTTSSWLGGLGDLVFGASGLRRENEELRREIERLRREVQESRERVAAAVRLQRLLDYREATGYRMIAAGVIGHDASGLYRTILIDRGSSSGVEHRQAVLAPDGVVGRVIKVFPRSALVLLVTDRSSGIDAIVQRTRDQGVVQGRGGSVCELKYLDRSAEVEVGDYVVTSGLGGGFPKGVWIGQVSGVNRGGDLFQSVDVRPSAVLDRLEEVWVVAGDPGEGR
ncbi:MAG: rod shape-determining protein MreC [Candidatus Methylomirabilia bacterium]